MDGTVALLSAARVINRRLSLAHRPPRCIVMPRNDSEPLRHIRCDTLCAPATLRLSLDRNLRRGGAQLSEANRPLAFWVEPGTHQEYPMSYLAYRRAREAQEKRPARHRSLGPEVDHYLSRRWRDSPVPEVDIVLTFRPGTPPRLRRLVAEVLRAIRRGRPARDAIRLVARRFGLRHARAYALITAGVDFEVLSRHGEVSAQPVTQTR
jgi:hypothetical protein